MLIEDADGWRDKAVVSKVDRKRTQIPETILRKKDTERVEIQYCLESHVIEQLLSEEKLLGDIYVMTMIGCPLRHSRGAVKERYAPFRIHVAHTYETTVE
jgi:hypothetical protein